MICQVAELRRVDDRMSTRRTRPPLLLAASVALTAGTLAAPGVATAQSCQGAPGASAIQQYCEAVPRGDGGRDTAGGGGPSGGGSGGSGAGVNAATSSALAQPAAMAPPCGGSSVRARAAPRSASRESGKSGASGGGSGSTSTGGSGAGGAVACPGAALQQARRIRRKPAERGEERCVETGRRPGRPWRGASSDSACSAPSRRSAASPARRAPPPRRHRRRVRPGLSCRGSAPLVVWASG